ncbi:ROK family transcriptional regulator [Streptomyces tsukubensis]|uniref:Transcriptional regulator n=1 Tax=Streptomyces tsukubensis TaxID=83656 RepID=A0A1V4A6X1_9ACTN|nr:ROK family transcriptional regulator [Streptomyces tsukubensis]OON77040.1 transcriptional regulator [Streptomyces tsukubensis]
MPVLRGHNTALVLDLLRVSGETGISRLELAERTGLTPQAVSKITARLRTSGLATEAGRRASTGGKPRTVLRLVPTAAYAVGVHLDRDELRTVLVDLAGTTVRERTAPLDLGAGADAVIEATAGEVELLLGAVPGDRGSVDGGGSADDGAGRPGQPGRLTPGPRGRVLGVGVGVPGPLDHREGVLHRVTGFPDLDGFPLRDALAARLGLPVTVDKDTNAAALGPALGMTDIAGPVFGAGEGTRPGSGPGEGVRPGSGPGEGVRPGSGSSSGSGLRLGPGGGSFAYLHLGTGLGAGLVLGGLLHRGARTGAGEFGHQVIQLDGPLCGCGDRGCVEALCLAAVGRGDPDEAARVLGTAASNLVGLLDIDLVLLGGRTIAAESERYVAGVEAVLARRAGREGAGPAVPVRLAPGGVRGIADGAAQLVLAPVFGRADTAGATGLA